MPFKDYEASSFGSYPVIPVGIAGIQETRGTSRNSVFQRAGGKLWDVSQHR